MTSQILTTTLAAKIFRNEDLRERLLQLENSTLISDETTQLAQLVNTSKSRSEVLSRWVRYREGYSPSIVHHILNKFPINSSTEYVLDPMCGSGSTQVACQQSGLASAGTDVSPYAVLVSKVKTTRLSKKSIVLLRTKISTLSSPLSYTEEDLSETEHYLSRFFPESNFQKLLCLKKFINKNFSHDELAFNFAKVALLAIVEDASNRKKDGNGLATRDSKVSDVLGLYRTQVETMLHDLESATWLEQDSYSFRASALDLHESSTRAGKHFGKKIGAVIFSPPYANSFDYYESYKLELLFGDFFSINTLAVERESLIRSYRQVGKSKPMINNNTVELLISELLERIPEKEAVTGKKDGRSRLLPNLLRGYFEDMSTMIEAASSCMESGSYMAIVVDQSAYLGVLIPTDLLLAEIGTNRGFSLEEIVICRSAKTSGQQLTIQPALGEVLRESAVVMRKI